jgi:hypothetical protein
MSLENDEDQAEPKDLTLILAIAGRIDAQVRLLAQHLDKDRHIYYAYAALDSLSTVCTMSKYFCDLAIPGNSSDTMHDLIMTPGGFIAITLESAFLVSFSVLATHFESEQNDPYKKFIASAWPYLRDMMKGLKNGYKGWRSAVTAINLMGLADIKFLVAPLGLALGLVAAANRFWLRNMTEDRKLKMSINSKLLLEIKKLANLSRKKYKNYLRKIQFQSTVSRTLGFAAMAIGGVLDGMYLYVGVLSLAALSPPLLLAMAIICSIYVAVSAITRVYEEYEYQRRLIVTQLQCQLVLHAKAADSHYTKLLLLRENPNPNAQELDEIWRMEIKVCKLISKFEEKRELLKQKSNSSYFCAFLQGIKNGLAAYGALASILFLIGSIVLLTGIPFPPLLLISCVVVGLAFMVGFAIHSLVMNYIHLKKQEQSEEGPYHQLLALKNQVSQRKLNLELPETKSFRASLKDGLSIDSSSQFPFPEWFEFLRSLFSGIGKGQKFVDCIFGPFFQEKDEQGHYNDNPFTYVLGTISAAFFGVVLGLRALSKGLGRAPLGQSDLSADIEMEPTVKEIPFKDISQESIKNVDTIQAISKVKTSAEPVQEVKHRTDSLKPSTYSFFKPKEVKRSYKEVLLANEIDTMGFTSHNCPILI